MRAPSTTTIAFAILSLVLGIAATRAEATCSHDHGPRQSPTVAERAAPSSERDHRPESPAPIRHGHADGECCDNCCTEHPLGEAALPTARTPRIPTTDAIPLRLGADLVTSIEDGRRPRPPARPPSTAPPDGLVIGTTRFRE